MTLRFILKMILALHVAAALGVAATAAFSKQVENREIKQRDLPKEIGQAFCQGNFYFRNLWKYKIFDAQVDGVLLTSFKEGETVNERQATERAKELAQSEGKYGYAGGACGGGTAWAAAFPSANPLGLKGDILDLKGAAPCDGTLKVSWVAEDRGGAQVIRENPVSHSYVYKLPIKKNGFISVVCQNRDKNQSPRELYLAPIGQPKFESPLSLASQMDPAQDKLVLNWINAKRVAEGLGPLRLLPEVAVSASTLIERKQVTHNMQLLAQESLRLKKINLQVIGENRVKAENPSETLLLLWISPGHRDLLLNRAATGIGIAVNKNYETFVDLVLVMPLDEKKK